MLPPELLPDVPPAPVVLLEDDPLVPPVVPLPLMPVPPALPLAPVPLVVVSVLVLPGVPGAPPMPLVLLLVPVPPVVLVSGVVVVELDELEPGLVVVVPGVTVVVSSFLLHATADNAMATAVAIKSCLVITLPLCWVEGVFLENATRRVQRNTRAARSTPRKTAGAP